MLINDSLFTTIWCEPEDLHIHIIDQRALPHELVIAELKTIDDVCFAITEMLVRGAPLIGVTAAYGLALALKENPSNNAEEEFAFRLIETRPTAMNLRWAIERIRNNIL